MNWRLGAVLLGCMATTTACGPPIYGDMIVGTADGGGLTVVIGYCEPDRPVHLSLGGGNPGAEVGFALTHPKSAEVMRVTLRSGEVPDGWTSSDTLTLPDRGLLYFSARVEGGKGWGESPHRVRGLEVDSAAVPPLPDDADKKVVEDC